jgi:AcrR family transcriptional regulator
MRFIRTHPGWHRRTGVDPLLADCVEEALPALCLERSFADVTVPGLCARAGITEERFHSGYRNLEDCFARVYEHFAAQFLERMFDAVDADLSWREQIRAVAWAFLGYLQEDPARARFTAVDALHAGEQAQLVRDAVFAGLFALIDQGRQELDDPDSLTLATAESVGGGIFRQIRLAIEREGTANLDALVPGLMFSVVLPYLGPEAAAEELEIAPPALTG